LSCHVVIVIIFIRLFLIHDAHTCYVNVTIVEFEFMLTRTEDEVSQQVPGMGWLLQ